MLWIGRAININIVVGCWNQSGPLAEVKALKAASSYATFLGSWYGPVYISFPLEYGCCLQQRLQEIKAADRGMTGCILPLAWGDEDQLLQT